MLIILPLSTFQVYVKVEYTFLQSTEIDTK
jgi:hypothetical protein